MFLCSDDEIGAGASSDSEDASKDNTVGAAYFKFSETLCQFDVCQFQIVCMSNCQLSLLLKYGILVSL